MLLTLIYLCAVPVTPLQNPTESKIVTHELNMAKYPLEILEYIRDSVADSAQDCRKFVDDELRAERKLLRDTIPIILDGINTSIENSTLSRTLSDHILRTETLNRYLEERICSFERSLLQQTIVTSPPHWSTPLHSSPAPPRSIDSTLCNQGAGLTSEHPLENDDINFLQPSLVLPTLGSNISPSKASPTNGNSSLLSSPLLSTQTLCSDMADIALMQVDGNMTLTNLSDPAIISAGSSSTSLANQKTPTVQYNYRLNSVNQTRRLFENTSRPPSEIRYSNPQTINGKSHPTNVSIDCNSGVYLSSVKPALERIAPGWQRELLNTLIQCDEVSPRSEASGRLVCTKLVLYLTESTNPMQRSKTVLHFYHTSNSVQVQGSQVMSTGVTTPVWLVTNFLEPLASNHATQNASTIDAINQHIQHSSTFNCGSCKSPLNPSASNPKDQELPCSRCKNLFHKKCTDRRKTTANWRKTPWYCSACITGSQESLQASTENSTMDPSNSSLNPTATLFTPLSVPPAPATTNAGPPPINLDTTTAQQAQANSSQRSDTAGTHRAPATAVATQWAGAASAQRADTPGALPVPSHSGHARRPSPAPTTSAVSEAIPSAQIPSESTQTIKPSQPSFPSTATRQRSSNVNAENPELEFLKTALSSLRSTVTQQEVENKRLKETLEIRNKRITNLEAQVGHASDIIADRDIPSHHSGEKLKDLTEKIELLSRKVEKLHEPQTSNSIVINSCHPNSSHPTLQKASSQTQTDIDDDIPHSDAMHHDGDEHSTHGPTPHPDHSPDQPQAVPSTTL